MNPAADSSNVEVEIKSLSERIICMTNSDWPTDEGFIDSASERVFIEIAEKMYPFKNYNMGVCPHKECAISLGPGESLSAELDYRNFYLPPDMYSKEKSVVFQPVPFWCDDGRWLEW